MKFKASKEVWNEEGEAKIRQQIASFLTHNQIIYSALACVFTMSENGKEFGNWGNFQHM